MNSLEDKLDSIESIEGFCTLLGKLRVSVDWHGRRLASSPKYEGVVTIEEIARKFLNFPHFVEVEPNSTLLDRLGLYRTWEKIETLYALSDQCLLNTRIYRFALPVLETAVFYTRTYPTALDIILGRTAWGKEEHIFQFKSFEYDAIWPNIRPKKIIYLAEGRNPEGARLIATFEMVKAVTVGNRLK